MNQTLEIVPSPVARIGFAAFEIAVGLGVIALAQPWRRHAFNTQEWLLLGIGSFLLLAGIEFPGRKVIVGQAAIQERLWFHWRTHGLGFRVIVGRDSRGRVAVGEAPTGKIIFRFVREFGRPSEVEASLMAFFRAAGRLDMRPN